MTRAKSSPAMECGMAFENYQDMQARRHRSSATAWRTCSARCNPSYSEANAPPVPPAWPGLFRPIDDEHPSLQGNVDVRFKAGIDESKR